MVEHQPDNGAELILVISGVLTTTALGTVLWAVGPELKVVGGVASGLVAAMEAKFVGSAGYTYAHMAWAEYSTAVNTGTLFGKSVPKVAPRAKVVIREKTVHSAPKAKVYDSNGVAEAADQSINTTIIDLADNTILHVVENVSVEAGVTTAESGTLHSMVKDTASTAGVPLAKRKMSMVAEEKLAGEALKAAESGSGLGINAVKGADGSTFYQVKPN
jgi:hypothetical protein